MLVMISKTSDKNPPTREENFALPAAVLLPLAVRSLPEGWICDIQVAAGTESVRLDTDLVLPKQLSWLCLRAVPLFSLEWGKEGAFLIYLSDLPFWFTCWFTFLIYILLHLWEINLKMQCPGSASGDDGESCGTQLLPPVTEWGPRAPDGALIIYGWFWNAQICSLHPKGFITNSWSRSSEWG